MWFENDYEPKMPFKFRASLSIGGIQARWYNVKSVDRPSFEISTTTHKHLNTEVKFPTNVRWNPITITMVDMIDNEVLFALKQYYNKGFSESLILQKQDYKNNTTIEKINSFSNLLTIQQLSSDGGKSEEWVIENFHIKSFTLQQANYDTEGLSTVSMVIEYDWAFISQEDSPQLSEIPNFQLQQTEGLSATSTAFPTVVDPLYPNITPGVPFSPGSPRYNLDPALSSRSAAQRAERQRRQSRNGSLNLSDRE